MTVARVAPVKMRLTWFRRLVWRKAPNPLMVSLSNHPAVSGDSSFRASFDQLRMSGVVSGAGRGVPRLVHFRTAGYADGQAGHVVGFGGGQERGHPGNVIALGNPAHWHPG